MLNSEIDLESPENWFSGAMLVWNVDFYEGNMSSRSETQYEVQISFRHDVVVVKPIT